MPPKTKIKACDKKVRRGSELVTCGMPMRATGDFGAMECKNWQMHVLPFVTGWCNSGYHEGTKPKDASGKAVRTCHIIMRCPCDCHTQVEKMFEISGLPRIHLDNPEWMPVKSPYWMPSWEDLAPITTSSTTDGVGTPDDIEGPPLVAPVPAYAVAPHRERTFAPTASGRTAKGELESWVKNVCDQWLMNDIDNREPLTPSRISRVIGSDQGIKDPSSGAVDAVLKRWIKLGFATVEFKPTRFIGYTEDGLKYGLDALKKRAKMNAKVAASSQGRTFRR